MASRYAAVILSALFIFMHQAKAEDLDLPEEGSQNQTGAVVGEVAVEKTEDYYGSYKSRRGKHGFLFSVSSEQFFPSELVSTIDAADRTTVIGEDSISLVGVELGYKYNFSLGSLGFLFNYATGSLDHKIDAANSRSLKLTKQGLSASFALDNFLQEPWIVPYAEVGAHQFVFSEEAESASDLKSNESSTGVALNYKLGLLFQLDWIEKLIDKDAKAEHLKSSGLENTFIDVYYATYMPSDNTIDPNNIERDDNGDIVGEPNLSSEGQMGIGLKLEF